MQTLELDFRATRRAPRWVAPLLLAVAVAFAGDVVYSFAKERLALTRNETALARLEPHGQRAKPAPADEVAAARETVQRLSTPWAKLFAALESAASEKVALLSIEPDPKAGTVLISGDSKDYLAALTYVLNLSRADALSRVQLAHHEVKSQDPQHPVAFSVSAAWSRGRP
jgi:Tfp pilus assembly protein PilN